MGSMQPHGEIPEFRRRYRYLVAVVLLTFIVLAGRLWQLQVVRGERYAKATEDNFIQEVRIPTVRGLVYDRKRRPVITNRPSYDVYVTPRFVTAAAIEKLVQILALEPERAAALRKRVKNVRGRRVYSRRLLLRDISRDQLARLEMRKEEMPGIGVRAMAHRNYLHGNLTAPTPSAI